MTAAATTTTTGALKTSAGLTSYYQQKIEHLELTVRDKTQNLRRLQAQRNELNSKGTSPSWLLKKDPRRVWFTQDTMRLFVRVYELIIHVANGSVVLFCYGCMDGSSVRLLREELQLLQEPGSYVGEVVKQMGKSKVLVKVNPEGKYVVDVDKAIDITKCTPNTRVALRNDSYVLHKILPTKVDPLVSLMKVEKVPDSTYDMIGGLDKQIREIKEVIELPIKHPELFDALGVAQPKGVLLYGPPGTGKTLLARAVAHHTDCTFIRVSGAELVQKYIGEGSRMVRELFVMAREASPSIIFMDEIDSIGSSRMEGGGDSEVQRTMLELLNQLDGFEPAQNIKVIMATNRIDILDAALLRPGRIDRKIEFPNPTEVVRLLLTCLATTMRTRSFWKNTQLSSSCVVMTAVAYRHHAHPLAPNEFAARHQPQGHRREDANIVGRRVQGRVHGGRHVCAARAPDPRDTGGL